jgi:hypothetical protein
VNAARAKKMTDGLLDEVRNFEPGMEGTRFEISTDWMVSRADRDRVAYEITNALRNGAQRKYIDDPDLLPDESDDIEVAMWKIAYDHRTMIAQAMSNSSALQFMYERGIRSQLSVGGVRLTLTHMRRGPFPMSKRERLMDPSITREFEEASTRVGKVVLQELNSRITQRVDASMQRHSEVMDQLSEVLGVHRDALKMENGQLRVNISFTPEQKQQALKILEESGVRFSDPTLHKINARSLETRLAFTEVMEEVRTVGGVLHGTPQHRKSEKVSAHQIVISGSARYPSSWIDSSNDVGAVRFETSQGRGQYKPSTSTIKHNLTVPTMIHEMAHRFEDTVPGLLQLEEEFYARRTRGESAQSLKKMFPTSNYLDSEVTRPDQFFDPYAGRDYAGVAYEVFTMGVEQASTRKQSVGIDDDHAAFVLGALATLLPEA